LRVAEGDRFAQVAAELASLDVVRSALVLRLWARLTGRDRQVEWGDYVFQPPVTPPAVVDRLTRPPDPIGRVTIPEGLTVDETLALLVAHGHGTRDAYVTLLRDPRFLVRESLPLPGGEGYLFPDTYFVARGVPVRTVVREMVERYREIWTPERRARLDSIGMTEGELVTLASIVQAEARRSEEMPRIAGVYHNRLEIGWLLQADPTVLYALGGYRARLLFAAIDSVADNPYNTYTQPGLPPGPIGSPGEAAIDAALAPADDYLYFVAWPDGTHVFTRSLADHNRAVDAARRARTNNGAE
jgi:UPF0755 protein